MSVQAIGVVFIVIGLALAAGGLVLIRRFRDTDERSGFRPSFVRREAWLTYLGQLGFMLGLCAVMVGVMLAFF